MAAVQGGVRFDKIAEKWHALAQRRLAYVRELDCSGRWQWYYAENQFRSNLREAERVAALWAKLAGLPSALGESDIRPAA
ncbi:MAG TPA: TIGR03809 family protein [Pseudolabrys sp.]